MTNPVSAIYDRSRPLARGILALALAVGLSSMNPSICRAQRAAGNLPAQVQAHLAAGEFAPALRLAQQAPDRAAADDLLRQVAAAQAAAGHRRAALSTAADISDERVRGGTLSSIRDTGIGGFGGNQQVDFDALIDLIKTTVRPPSWDDGGGQGTIDSFPGGVYVDAAGVMRPLIKDDRGGQLADVLRRSKKAGAGDDARRDSAMRKISLNRLEKHVQLRLAAGERPDEAMRVLAGLQRIKYVFVYPDQGDVVIAGPAGDWKMDREGRAIHPESGKPVLQLDDLVVVLRHMSRGDEMRFGCNIKPQPEALAKTKALLEQSARTPLRPGAAARKAWLEKVRGTVGKQTIEVYGVDPRTRVGRVLVEADYRMKLIGMGLEEGVQGVPSYLSLVKDSKGRMDVLRWWFTLNYEAVKATPQRDGFELVGQGVKVLSENELLTQQGQRVHTGDSEPLNREFAHAFTRHFEALAAKYPVYAELRNIFDLALVGAIVRTQRLDDRAGWHMTCFGSKNGYQPSLGTAPKQVETVINHRMTGRVIVAGVSGGVTIDPRDLVQPRAIKTEAGGVLAGEKNTGRPEQLPPGRWWWD